MVSLHDFSYDEDDNNDEQPFEEAKSWSDWNNSPETNRKKVQKSQTTIRREYLAPTSPPPAASSSTVASSSTRRTTTPTPNRSLRSNAAKHPRTPSPIEENRQTPTKKSKGSTANLEWELLEIFVENQVISCISNDSIYFAQLEKNSTEAFGVMDYFQKNKLYWAYSISKWASEVVSNEENKAHPDDVLIHFENEAVPFAELKKKEVRERLKREGARQRLMDTRLSVAIERMYNNPHSTDEKLSREIKRAQQAHMAQLRKKEATPDV